MALTTLTPREQRLEQWRRERGRLLDLLDDPLASPERIDGLRDDIEQCNQRIRELKRDG